MTKLTEILPGAELAERLMEHKAKWGGTGSINVLNAEFLLQFVDTTMVIFTLSIFTLFTSSLVKMPGVSASECSVNSLFSSVKFKYRSRHIW